MVSDMNSSESITEPGQNAGIDCFRLGCTSRKKKLSPTCSESNPCFSLHSYFLCCWLICEILLKLRLYFTFLFKDKNLLLDGTEVYAAVIGAYSCSFDYFLFLLHDY